MKRAGYHEGKQMLKESEGQATELSQMKILPFQKNTVSGHVHNLDSRKDEVDFFNLVCPLVINL